MSDYTRLINEHEHGDEGHRIMSSDVPDTHVMFDVQHLDDVLAANESARFEAWVDSIEDAFEDGDDL